MPSTPAKTKPEALNIKIKASNINFAKTLNGALMGKASKINVKILPSVKNLASTKKISWTSSKPVSTNNVKAKTFTYSPKTENKIPLKTSSA